MKPKKTEITGMNAVFKLIKPICLQVKKSLKPGLFMHHLSANAYTTLNHKYSDFKKQ